MVYFVFSFWPKFTASQKVKKRELPDKQKWRRYKIRVFAYTGKYGKGAHVKREYPRNDRIQLHSETNIVNISSLLCHILDA